MSWSFSMTPAKPAEVESKLDEVSKPSYCTDDDWAAFKSAAKVLAARHGDEPYVHVSGNGHDPVAGSYPRRSIQISVRGTESA